MNKPLYKTGAMFKTLLKRDWAKLIFWIVGMIAFAASGAGKMQVATGPGMAATMYTMFVKNPAMVGLFGPTPVKSPSAYTLGVVFGQTMTLITAITFAIISVIYVINRTRKEEDDGVAELFRSFPVGKLANTTAVVLEIILLHIVMALLLAFSIQAQNVDVLNNLSSNLLFASSASAQGLMWGMIALFFAQIFPDAGGAKGATFGLLGLLYVIRMGTDVGVVQAGWFNPLSWSYLDFPYAKGYETWLGVGLTLIFSIVILIFSYILELRRDVNAGYLPEGRGHSHAQITLLSFPGLVLNLQKKMIIGWLGAVFVLGLVYGSMFGQMGQFISQNALVKQMFVGNATATDAITGNFMVTLFSILSILVSSFGVILLSRMITEERKNRQEQLYALPTSRIKVYLTYVLTAIIGSVIAQFIAILGIYIEQSGNKNALSFSAIVKPGMIWIVGIIFVIALLSLLIAFIPRFTGVIWVYIGFLLFMSYLGHILSLPKWVEKMSIYDYIPKLPVDKMDWGNVSVILILSVLMILIGFIGYRKCDRIGA